jgi:hypothetical protein
MGAPPERVTFVPKVSNCTVFVGLKCHPRMSACYVHAD